MIWSPLVLVVPVASEAIVRFPGRGAETGVLAGEHQAAACWGRIRRTDSGPTEQ